MIYTRFGFEVEIVKIRHTDTSTEVVLRYLHSGDLVANGRFVNLSELPSDDTSEIDAIRGHYD